MEKHIMLINKALAARQNAYAPYSGFAVGAALMTVEGEVFCGCNVENASYSLTICTERSALCAAISAGKRAFDIIAVVGAPVAEATPLSIYASPCGACRQALAEFSPTMTILLAKSETDYQQHLLSDLLPLSFTLNNN